MRCGDLFEAADVFNLDDWRRSDQTAVVPSDEDGEGAEPCK